MNVGNKKALSPIFASIIILAVVTVLFIPVFIWSTGLMAESRSFWDNLGTNVKERIVIEEVNLRSGQSSCTIYVRNIGKTAIIVDDVLISSPDRSIHVYDDSTFSTDFESVVQGDLMTVTISSLGFVPSSEETFTIKVFTARGVGDTYQIIA